MDTRTARWLLILSLSLCILSLSSASPVESVKALSPPQIQLEGADIVLQWPTDPGYIRYDVYRSTGPYFTPDESTLLVFNSGTSYRDRCLAGDVNTSYFYVVRGVRSDGTYDDLPPVGTFSFWLTSPWSTPSTLYVDRVSGADTGRCTDPVHPCASIGHALCRAWRGDTVQVAQGIYNETLTINKAVTLRGGYEPLGWSRCLGNCTTEIRGDGASPVIAVGITQAERATLDGFKITGGNIGISVGLSTLDVMNAVLTGNQAYDGGGMHIDHAAVTIANTLIAHNRADHCGGAMVIMATSDVRIFNSTIVSNTAPITNGIFNSLSGCSVVNSILWGHAGQDFGGHLYFATYSDVEMNLDGDGKGNIHKDPQFAESANNDFHLQADSPCIDAGGNADAPPYDFEGDPRPVDGNADAEARADMGFDEVAGSSSIGRFVHAASGSDTGLCTDPEHPCATIGYAISQAITGNTVFVAQGTYPESLSIRKTLTLRGAYDPPDWSRCLGQCTSTIRGDLVHPVLDVQTTLSDTTLIDGFTITGGNGGITVDLSALAIQNSRVISNHTTASGGGLHIDHSAVTITNTLIAHNQADVCCGAIHIIRTDHDPQSDVRIVNSTVTGNRAGFTNGAFCSLSSCRVINSIFWDHAGQDFDGWPPWNISYTDSGSCQPGDGNICEDPRFVDPADDDYHLLANSPCIDAGLNTAAPWADFEANPRPVDGNGDTRVGVDLGADELVPSPDFGRYVYGASGSDAGSCTDPGRPCATIGYAVSQAITGNTVFVAQGAYTESLTLDKVLTLTGGREPVGWSQCLRECRSTISGDGTRRVIDVHTTLSDTTMIDGFTITGGNGGINVNLSALAIQNSRVISNHTTASGGGMHIDRSAVTITNTLIAHNRADGYSGAMHIISTISVPGPQSEVRIMNSTIVSNTAASTNGIYNSLSWTSAVNSILWGHAGQDFGGHMYSATYTDIEMDLDGEGNMHEEPRFVDPANDDYHLQAGSPCIDAGSNASMPAADFENDPRPLDGDADGSAIVDMGADEYRPSWHFPLGYGPYRPGQAPGSSAPSSQQIGQDLEIIEQETRTLRTYGSCPPELAIVPAIAASHGMDIYLGANLSADPTYNDAQIDCLVDLANQYPNIVMGLLGNESLTLGVLTEAQLAGYLDQAGTAVGISVTAGEGWNVWCNEANAKPRCEGRPALAAAADLILAHTHPYWEGVPVEHAAAHVVATYLLLRDLYPGREVVIGETGWPTCGDPYGNAEPGLANQRRFIEELWDWSNLYDVPVLNFEAFDEAWKEGVEGKVGRCWGVYNEDRTPKHASLDWNVPEPDPAPSDPAVTIKHPAGDAQTTTKPNCAAPIVGRAYHAEPGWHVKVEVFTDAWYVQDKWYAGGLASIVDGAWAMPEVYLAGQGAYNNHRVRATLVDETGAVVASDEVMGIVRANSCVP